MKLKIFLHTILYVYIFPVCSKILQEHMKFIETEKSFSQLCVDNGIPYSFLQNFEDSAYAYRKESSIFKKYSLIFTC